MTSPTHTLSPTSSSAASATPVPRERLTWYLWQAIDADDETQVRRWVRLGADIAVARSGSRGSALQAAIREEAFGMFAAMLDESTALPPEVVQDAVMVSLIYGNLKCLTALLRRGAAPHETTLEAACKHPSPDPEALFLLLQHGYRIARGPGHEDGVRLLVQAATGKAFHAGLASALVAAGYEIPLRERVHKGLGPVCAEYREWLAALDAATMVELTTFEAERAVKSRSSQP